MSSTFSNSNSDDNDGDIRCINCCAAIEIEEKENDLRPPIGKYSSVSGFGTGTRTGSGCYYTLNCSSRVRSPSSPASIHGIPVSRALSTIFNLNSAKESDLNVNANVNVKDDVMNNADAGNNSLTTTTRGLCVCFVCHLVLSDLYRTYIEFSQLRNENSILGSKLSELKNISKLKTATIIIETSETSDIDAEQNHNLNLSQVTVRELEPDESAMMTTTTVAETPLKIASENNTNELIKVKCDLYQMTVDSNGISIPITTELQDHNHYSLTTSNQLQFSSAATATNLTSISNTISNGNCTTVYPSQFQYQSNSDPIPVSKGGPGPDSGSRSKSNGNNGNKRVRIRKPKLNTNQTNSRKKITNIVPCTTSSSGSGSGTMYIFNSSNNSLYSKPNQNQNQNECIIAIDQQPQQMKMQIQLTGTESISMKSEENYGDPGPNPENPQFLVTTTATTTATTIDLKCLNQEDEINCFPTDIIDPSNSGKPRYCDKINKEGKICGGLLRFYNRRRKRKSDGTIHFLPTLRCSKRGCQKGFSIYKITRNQKDNQGQGLQVDNDHGGEPGKVLSDQIVNSHLTVIESPQSQALS